MQSNPLKINLSKDTIVSQVAAFLYATKQVPEHVEIIDINFGHKMQVSARDTNVIIPIEVYFKPDEVDVIYFDGT